DRAAVLGRGRRARVGERRRLRPRGLGLDAGRRPGAADVAQTAVRHGVDQHSHPTHARDAARRLQAERVRQGHVDLLDRGVHQPQARDGVARLGAKSKEGSDPTMSVRPFLVNGEWRTGEGTFEVHSPYDDAVVAEIGVPTAEDVEEAVATAAATFEGARNLPGPAPPEARGPNTRGP